jgi:hypothetical protein
VNLTPWIRRRAATCGLITVVVSSILVATATTASSESLFTAPAQLAAGRHPTDVITVDVDRDRDLDLVVVDTAANDVVVFPNQGTGTFGEPARFPVRTELLVNEPNNVTSGDFNRDGAPDLAVSHTDEEISLLFNDGRGSFVSQPDVFVGFSIRVLAGDFNGDGASDIATTGGLDADDSHNGVFVVLNDGTGRFGAPRQFAVGSTSYELASADFNRDGDADLAVTNPAEQEIVILDNNGQGIFGISQREFDPETPLSLATADVDADGDADVVATTPTTDRVWVHENSGGTLAGAFGYSTGDAPQGRIGIADVDSNGFLDLAVANGESDDVSVLLGTEVFGSYRRIENVPSGDGANAVAAGDLNGDRVADLAVANFWDGTLSIFFSTAPPLAVDAGSDGSGSEGSVITLAGSASDGTPADGASVSWAVVAQEGTDPGASCTFANRRQPTTTITCTDDGVYTARLTLTAGEASRSDTVTVTVGNAAPRLSPLGVQAPSTACIGGNRVGLSFSVQDPGTNDTVGGSIDWGDGSAPEAFSGSSFDGGHLYRPGAYTPTVTASDDDGGTATASAPAAIALLYSRSELLPPINSDGSSTFQLGRKVPVKVQVTDCEGTPVSDLRPDVDLSKVSSTVTGSLTDIAVNLAADEGDDMHFDPTSGQYVFTLATRNSQFCTSGAAMCNGADLTGGTYRLTVTDPSFAPVTATIQIRER